jgi:hypothetical protein
MRDLVYFDVEKAASILSQFEGGLLREIREAEDRISETRAGIKASIKILEADMGGCGSDRLSRIETRVVHHDLLRRIEEFLTANEAVVDLNAQLDSEVPNLLDIRAAVEPAAYIQAEGWAVFEDYERLTSMVGNFNGLLEVIRNSARQSFEEVDEMKELRSTIAAQKQALDRERDKSRQQRARAELRKHEKQISDLLDGFLASTTAGDVPKWLVEGIRLWVSVFNPGQLHLRLYPFETVPEFHILANLKRSLFGDGDVENALFAYGKRPNIRLTLFGLVTSMPKADGEAFDPLKEFRDSSTDGPEPEARALERGFRSAFGGLHAFEELMRHQRWPNIAIYPIAVYRRVHAAPLANDEGNIQLPTGT